jgi:hypothetical protein
VAANLTRLQAANASVTFCSAATHAQPRKDVLHCACNMRAYMSDFQRSVLIALREHAMRLQTQRQHVSTGGKRQRELQFARYAQSGAQRLRSTIKVCTRCATAPEGFQEVSSFAGSRDAAANSAAMCVYRRSMLV